MDVCCCCCVLLLVRPKCVSRNNNDDKVVVDVFLSFFSLFFRFNRNDADEYFECVFAMHRRNCRKSISLA